MISNNYRLGDLIEQTYERNLDLKYKAKDVKGMTITKNVIPTKANVKSTDLSKFLIVHPGEFIYNPRTHGKRIGLGFNDSKDDFLISWNNIAFKIKDDASKIIIPEYLYMYFNRLEWDREACFRSWGSSTEVFSWEALCEMELTLPNYEIQQKTVDVYNALIKNQRAFESGIDDLKLTCDAYIEKLRKQVEMKKIGPYIKRIDIRNGKNGSKNVMGVSTTKEFREPTSKVNKNELSNYKICAPRQIAFVQTTHNEKVFCNAFNNTDQNIVVSSVNEVLECNEECLLPEFLCIFFNRTEFDRYARYNSWGSARETFTWQDLIEVEIPLPDINVQKDIVNIYNVYKIRKDINSRLLNQINKMCPLLIKGSIEGIN